MNASSILKGSFLAIAVAGCSYGGDDELLETGGPRRSKGLFQGTTENEVIGLKGEEKAMSGGTATAAQPGTNAVVGEGFAMRTLARAEQWVDVKMPYCGGVNGGTDAICGGICRRTGVHASDEWDDYRTDCSGFVSWAWALPAPGRTTYGFAPFKVDITTAISVDDLLPGDALNNANHVILFGGWANDEHTKARLLEEYDCGQVAVDRVRDVSKVSANQLRTPSGTFTAIRLDSRPTAD